MSGASTQPARLIDRVPFNIRQSVLDSGEFQRITSDFVQSHVHQGVSMLIDRLQKTEGFEDDLEALRAKPDYVEVCNENSVCLVEGDDGMWFHFQWNEPVEYPLDQDTGKCIVDFERFAKTNGLRLEDWRWNGADDEAVHMDDVTDENRADLVDGSVLPHIAAVAMNDASEMIGFLAEAAKRVGKDALAADLGTPSKFEKLFAGYLQNDSELVGHRDTFHGELEAAEDACRAYSIDADEPEIYEYWSVDDYFARHLEERGEVVARDFLDSLTVWGRCTTGQSISLDGVVSRIVRDVCSDEVDALIKKMFPNVGSTNERLAGVDINVLKAIEEKRLREVTFNYESRSKEKVTEVSHVVLDADAVDRGWLLLEHRLASGAKNVSATPEDSRSLDDLKAYLVGSRKLIGDVVFAAPDQELIDTLADSLANYHRVNKDSVMHVVPDNLEKRLAAISPAYAREHQDNGPSLG